MKIKFEYTVEDCRAAQKWLLESGYATQKSLDYMDGFSIVHLANLKFNQNKEPVNDSI